MGTVYLHPIPWAFLSLIPAYIIGEAWLGICLTVAIELVPIEISPASISLFLFISNNISSVMPLLLPLLKDYYGLQRAMLILFPGLYVIAAALFSVSLFILIVSDMSKKHRDSVKLKSPGHVREASRQRQRRRKAHNMRQSERSALLGDETNQRGSYGIQRESESSSDSDCGDFEEVDDDREQNETQKAVAAIPSNPNYSSPSRRGGREGWRAMGRGRGYGSLDNREGGVASPADKKHSASVQAGPAPVVGSVSKWSAESPSKEEEKQWLAVSQEGI